MYSSSKDIIETFPEEGGRCGYCGAQFGERPPDEAVYAVNDHTDFTAKCLKQVKFYECKGEFLIISATFATKKPWVVPLNIKALNLQQINKLPLNISLYNQKFQLGGCTINTGAHFTSIIMWHGRPYLYDGLQPTKTLHFVPYYPDMKFTDCLGSYVFYFITH